MFEYEMPPILTGNDWFVAKPALEKSLEWQNGMLAVMVVLAGATVFYAIKTMRRTGRSYPLYICIGAALACFYEPLGDLLAHVTYHEVGQIRYTATLGFSVPLWVLPSYVIFFGFPVLVLGNLIEQGITIRKWMAIFFISVAGAWIFEVPILGMGATEYFGANQPFKILNYPVWMGFVNTCTMFVVATAVHFLKDAPIIARFPFLFVPLMPMLVTGANASAALPLGSAINASLDPAFVNLMACGSMALSVLYAWIAGSLVCVPQRATSHAVGVASPAAE